jgi:predicted lipoprotein with Yx(FWY)xxD motif
MEATVRLRFAAVLTGFMMVAGCASMGAPDSVKYMNGVMTDSSGMTVYTFDKDPTGKSVCNGKCAANWPPLHATPGAKASGDFSIVTRDDGSRQWAYHGKPLYLWRKDQKPGDRTGEGVNNVWHTVAQQTYSRSGGY